VVCGLAWQHRSCNTISSTYDGLGIALVTDAMGQVLDRHPLLRLNLAVVLAVFWAALATCVVAAMVHDVGRLFKVW